jgi:DNA polymerase I-like protein with 3'-5' exonuclease and polymerase domains
LQEQWGILSIERNNLEEQKRTFEVRESKYLEVKDLIPSAAELKSMGVDFTLINAFINVIKEYASKKMIDERAATWNLAEDLKNWLELEGFEKAISNAKNQLALLDMALEGQKQAIAIVADLKKSGMTTEDISNLVKTVSRWSDQSQGQGNGGEFELDTHINLPEGWGDAKN